MVRYKEVKDFVEANHRNPSKYKPEEKLMVHFLKRGRKLINAGSDEYTLDTHIHPYVHEDGHPVFTFKVAAAAKKELLLEVILDAAPGSKEEKTINDLCLNEIYSMHGTTEINDLMEFKHKYPAGYLKQLMRDVLKKAVDNGQTLTLEEVYRMLFGVELNEEKFLNRPLSKMKHDILHEMGVI